jgi:hypothetical protein
LEATKEENKEDANKGDVGSRGEQRGGTAPRVTKLDAPDVDGSVPRVKGKRSRCRPGPHRGHA